MSSSWFDANSITKNVASFTQKAAQIASEALIDDDPEKARLTEELEDLKRQYIKLKNSIKNGSIQNGSFSIESSHPAACENLEEITLKLQEEVEEWKSKFSSFQAESEEKYQDLSTNYNRIKALASDKIKRLVAQNQELQAERDQLVSSSSNPSASSNRIDDKTIKSYQSQIEELNKKNENSIQEVLLLQTRIDEMELENYQLKEKNAALESSSQPSEATNYLKDEQMKWKPLYEESVLELKNLQSEYQGLANAKNELEMQFHHETSEKEQLIIQVESINIDREQAQSLVSEKESKIHDLNTIIENQKRQINELKKLYHDHKLQLEELMQGNTTQSAEFEELQTLCANQNAQIKELEKEVSLQKIEIENLESVMAEQRMQFESGGARDHKPTQTATPETHEISTEMQFSNDHDDNQNQASFSEIESKLKSEINELNVEIKTLREKLATEEVEKTKVEEQLTAKLEELKSKWSSSEGIVSDLTKSLEASNLKIKELLTHQNQLEVRLKSVQDEKSDVEVKFAALQTLADTNQNQSVIDELQMELEKARLDGEAARNQFEEYRIQVQETNNNDASDTITVLQGQIQEYQTTCAELQNSINEMQISISNLTSENETLNQEKIGLTDKLQQFKLAVGAKIQQEIEENDRIRGELTHVTLENEELSNQVSTLRESLETALKKISQLEEVSKKESNSETEAELAYLQSKSVDLISQLQKSEAEVARLREYLLEVEESSTQEALVMQTAIQEYKLQISSLEKEREEWSSVRQHEEELRANNFDLLDESKAQVSILMEEKIKLDKRIEEDGLVIRNLQNVLAQFEAAKEQDIEDALAYLKKSQSEAETNFKKYKQLFDESQKRLEKLEADAQLFESLKKELQEKSALVGHLRHDIVQLQSHLNEAMRYMKQGSNEDTVDRKLVANLIVGLMLAKYGDPKRFEILTLIASILKLSEDEKAKVGLIRLPGTSISPRNSVSQVSPAENFMDMWITFLQTETSKDKSESATSLSPVDSPAPSQPPIKKQFSFF